MNFAMRRKRPWGSKAPLGPSCALGCAGDTMWVGFWQSSTQQGQTGCSQEPSLLALYAKVFFHFLIPAVRKDKPCRQHDTLIIVTPCNLCLPKVAATRSAAGADSLLSTAAKGQSLLPGKLGQSLSLTLGAVEPEPATFGCTALPPITTFAGV